MGVDRARDTRVMAHVAAHYDIELHDNYNFRCRYNKIIVLGITSLPNDPYPQLRHNIKMAALWMGPPLQTCSEKISGVILVCLIWKCVSRD